MTDVQNNLYQFILTTITNREDNYRGKGLITDYTCLRKVIVADILVNNYNSFNLLIFLDLDTSESFGRCVEKCH